MSLAREALSGVVWTAAERFGLQLIHFAVTIVLARLLTPDDFGLVAMLMIVFAVSGVVVNGGYTAALIREPRITEQDKATAFWLNMLGAVIVYGLIWALAPPIAAFFEQPALLPLTRFMGLSLVFMAPTLVQQAELMHRMAFKRLGLISLAGAVLAGAMAIAAALMGAGVWALAINYVLAAACTSVFLWIAEPWYPKQWLDPTSIRKVFGFGSRLAASGLINETFQNVYKAVIGKMFTAATLGFYSQAQTFQRAASQGLVGVLQKVTYPLLATANDDPARLKRGYRKIIQTSSYVIFPAMIGLGLTAEPLLVSLLGEKWQEATPFLQILCVSGALYHLHSINLNVLKVVGRTDLFLRLELIKKAIITVAIVVGLQFGIWGLLVGQVISSYLALLVNMYYTREFIDYSIAEQLRDIAGVLWLSVPMVVSVWLVGWSISAAPPVRLAVMVSAGAAMYLATGLIVNAEPIQIMRKLIAPDSLPLGRFSTRG